MKNKDNFIIGGPCIHGVSNNGFECEICHPKNSFEEAARQTLTDFGEIMEQLIKTGKIVEPINNQQDKALVIIRGISGSGKSSFAKLLGFPYFEADQYFIDENGNYKFDATKLGHAHNYCKANVEDAMIRGEPIIIQSNTNTRQSELIPYIDLANKYTYKVFSLILEKRHNGVNKHNVPATKLLRMEDRLRSNIKLS